ncbi:MAG TPA: hypothetical protein VGH09_03150 [Solirubrobacteraceae bacterium]|jgi:hypothetical protein
MTPQQTTAKTRAAGQLVESRRPRELARRALWRFAPGYARRRSGRRGTAATVERLQADFERLRERHTEQIDRLEDLVRELILTAETLRRDIARRERRDEV